MSEHKYLPIYPSKNSTPENAITREAFLDAWADFAVRKPFIFLVGSLSNWAESHGDIDILVKAHDPTPLLDALDSIIVNMFEQKQESIADLLISVQKYIATESLFLNAKWRIERAFPDWRDRIHVLDDSFSGPFTNFEELADLVAVSRAEKKREEMDSKDQGCGKAWEVLFAEGMAVQYFEKEADARAFEDEIDSDAVSKGFGKDVIHVKHSWVHRHSKTKRCYSVNKKHVHYKTEELDQHFASSTSKKIELFHPVPLLKPIHGRAKGEIYSVDSVIDTIKSRKKDWFKANIVVEKKFDGVHCQTDKKGDTVRIWTEDGTEITKNCPTLVKEFAGKRLDFKVLGEVELWKAGEHQNRAITAGVLNTKEASPDEKYLIFNLFDCLVHDTSDIHMQDYNIRLRHLHDIKWDTVKNPAPHIKISQHHIVKTESELRKAIKYFSNLEGSEGAYLKILFGFPYLLTGKTTENIKFKNEISIDAQIVKVNIVEGIKKN